MEQPWTEDFPRAPGVSAPVRSGRRNLQAVNPGERLLPAPYPQFCPPDAWSRPLRPRPRRRHDRDPTTEPATTTRPPPTGDGSAGTEQGRGSAATRGRGAVRPIRGPFARHAGVRPRSSWGEGAPLPRLGQPHRSARPDSPDRTVRHRARSDTAGRGRHGGHTSPNVGRAPVTGATPPNTAHPNTAYADRVVSGHRRPPATGVLPAPGRRRGPHAPVSVRPARTRAGAPASGLVSAGRRTRASRSRPPAPRPRHCCRPAPRRRCPGSR